MSGLYLFTFNVYLFGHAEGVCGILIPRPVTNLMSLAFWKHGVLTTGPPGKSLLIVFFLKNKSHSNKCEVICHGCLDLIFPYLPVVSSC